MKLNELTPEQLERAKACTSPEELMSLAKECGLELSDEQLDAVSGGGWVEADPDTPCITQDCHILMG